MQRLRNPFQIDMSIFHASGKIEENIVEKKKVQQVSAGSTFCLRGTNFDTTLYTVIRYQNKTGVLCSDLPVYTMYRRMLSTTSFGLLVLKAKRYLSFPLDGVKTPTSNSTTAGKNSTGVPCNISGGEPLDGWQYGGCYSSEH